MSRLLSFACAATLFAGLIAVAGCGGGGGEGALGASGAISGKTTQAAASSPTTATPVPATGGTVVVVAVKNADGTTSNVAVTIPSVPGLASVPPNSPLAVINSGSSLLAGNFSGSGGLGIGTDGASSLASINTSGVTLSGLGALIQNLALPVDPVTGTRYVFTLPQGNVKTRDLTIGHTAIDGRIYVDLSGGSVTIINPVPLGYTGVIPNNGENAGGAFETVVFGPGNLGRSATLDVVYGNGFSLHQGRNIQPLGEDITINGTAYTNPLSAKFVNLTLDTSNVPAGGVSTVTLSIGDR